MSDAPPRPPLPRRKPAKPPSTPPIKQSPPPPRVDNNHLALVKAPRRSSLPKRRPRAKGIARFHTGHPAPPLETPDGMLVDLPLPMPNIAPSVMNPGTKRKEPDTESPTRLKPPSPVMRTSSPDIPDLFLDHLKHRHHTTLRFHSCPQPLQLSDVNYSPHICICILILLRRLHQSCQNLSPR